MSSPAATSKGTNWLLILGLSLVAAGVAYWINEQVNPPAEASVRAITNLADDHEVARADDTELGIRDGKFVGGDDRAFGAQIKRFGTEAQLRTIDRNVALNRAIGRSPVTEDNEVTVKVAVNRPTGCVPFDEPVLLYEIGGQVRYEQYSAPFNRPPSDPFGVVRDSSLGGALPYNDPNRHLALIYQVWDGINGTAWLPVLTGPGQSGRLLIPQASQNAGVCLRFDVNQYYDLRGTHNEYDAYTFKHRVLKKEEIQSLASS